MKCVLSGYPQISIASLNNVCALMNKSNTKFNNIGHEKWKCNIILEMLDCLYGLSDCGLSIDGARQCLTYAATI